jgi:hypothetical protein
MRRARKGPWERNVTMRRPDLLLFPAVLLLTPLGLVSCSDSSPSEPEPDPPTLTSVTVTSPIDTVMAVGRSTQLSAQARDQNGNVMPGVSFSWRSTNADAATVSGVGVVQGAGAGTSTIEADAGDAEGGLRMRVVAADLEAIQTLLEDPWVLALGETLGDASRATFHDALEHCAQALDDGHILNLAACLAEAGDPSASDTDDPAVLAVLSLVALRAEQLLAI